MAQHHFNRGKKFKFSRESDMLLHNFISFSKKKLLILVTGRGYSIFCLFDEKVYIYTVKHEVVLGIKSRRPRRLIFWWDLDITAISGSIVLVFVLPFGCYVA